MRRAALTLTFTALTFTAASLSGAAAPALARPAPPHGASPLGQSAASQFLSAATAPPGLDTGFNVAPGDTVTVAGSGSASYGTDYCTPTDDHPSTDPNGNRPGCGQKVDPHASDPAAPIGELLARTGCDASWSAVGTGGHFQSVEGGELYLLYNDSHYPDNTGGYRASVTITPPPPGYVPPAVCDHYDVRMEGWIPQRRVVDPVYAIAQHFLPGLPNAYAADLVAGDPPQCFSGAPLDLAAKHYRVSSTYGGDGHAGMGAGTYRVAKEVSFDSDGGKIFNFTPNRSLPPVGMSSRTHIIDNVTDHVTSTCTDTETGADDAAAPSAAGTSFTMSYQTTNPLAPPLVSPALTGTLTGMVDPSGALSLTFTHTVFPSHGLRVTINGLIALHGVINDVSCLNSQQVLGPAGAARLLYGLTKQASNSIVANPGGDARVDLPSPECVFAPPSHGRGWNR